MRRLQDRVAIITGGAGAIGRATGLRLASEGATIVLGDLDAVAAASAAEGIRSAGGRGVGIGVDVVDQASVAALVERTLNEFGRIDILHNNAGVLLPGSVTEVSVEAWTRTLAVNGAALIVDGGLTAQ